MPKTVKRSPKKKHIFLRNRATVIGDSLLKAHHFYLYNGHKALEVTPSKSLLGTKLGTLTLTKKLGKNIHNSERNRKRKLKNKKKK